MKKSICFITQTSGFGGTEVHTLSLIKLLQNKSSYIELIQCRHNVYDDIIKSFCQNRIKVINTNLSTNDSNTKLIEKWKCLLRNLDSDILILPKGWYGMGSLRFLKVCRKYSKKVYFIEHSLADPMPRKTSKSHFAGLVKGLGVWWYKEKYQRMKRSFYADQIIAVSNSIAEMLIKECWCPRKKVTVISNGVYANKFRRNSESGYNIREKYNISSDAFVFGMITRLDKVKGVDIAIRSFQLIHKGHPNKNLFLMICGVGNEEDSLKKLVLELNVEKKVIFTGFIDRPQEALSAIDCILFPSRKEGLPLALLEGMATECIPIVTRVGGMPETVNNSSLGWVVHPDDIDAFYKAMNEVISLDKVELKGMRKNLVNCIEQNFNAERSYERIMNTIGAV